MKIAIDIDETLIDFMGSFAEWQNRRYLTSYKVSQLQGLDFWTTWGYDKPEAIRRTEEFYFSPEQLLISVIDGAREVIEELAKYHELYTATARPERVKNITRRLIENNFPRCFKDHFCVGTWGIEAPAMNKAQRCKEEGIELVIDDSLRVINQCLEVGIAPVWYQKDWNLGKRAPEGVASFRHWKNIRDHILEKYTPSVVET
jgi:hypothetical protein